VAGEDTAQILGVYCERGFDPAFWAEPVNALTNAAFLIAGALALVRHRGDRAVMALALITVAIGVGSFLFHTLATRAAMLADVVPIQLFIATYFFLAMRRFFALGAPSAAAATVAFMAAAAVLPGFAPPAEPWRGLSGYLGGLAGLIGVGLALVGRPGPDGRAGVALLKIAALFALSLTFRTIDGAICEAVPTGAHPLWHLLNAAVLYALMAVLASARRVSGRIAG
jgi:hypothetical protein